MMAGSLLLPTASSLLSLFSSPSHLSHARQEHWHRYPVCKTVYVADLVVLIYVNLHTAHYCAGKRKVRRGGGLLPPSTPTPQ